MSEAVALSPAERARSLFSNQGLHRNAEFIAQLHDNAIDYLEQAPVLAMALGGRNTKADRLYVASRIGGPINRGERLRNVMSAVGLALPLRKLAATALFPMHYHTIRLLSSENPSTLAQIIPNSSGAQRRWFTEIGRFNSRCEMRYAQPTVAQRAWVIRNLADQNVQSGEGDDFADFLAAHPIAPLDRWTWQRAMLEVSLWHDRLATEKNLPGLIKPETQIDHSDWPDTVELDGYEFFKLTTPSMLMEEGRRMRHCVASYISDVMNGGTSIYSMRHEMRRIATVQITNRKVVQIKGFANKVVPKYCRALADKLLEAA